MEALNLSAQAVAEFVTPLRQRSPMGALFDATGHYRYSLWRCWEPLRPTLLMILLNPSTADAERDDPTIRRCRQFATAWGYGGLEIVNLFAYRTPHPRCLHQASEPIGVQTDPIIQGAITYAAQVVVAWGNGGSFLGRDRTVLQALVPQPLYCLGITRLGHPRHPLYLPKETLPERYDPAL